MELEKNNQLDHTLRVHLLETKRIEDDAPEAKSWDWFEFRSDTQIVQFSEHLMLKGTIQIMGAYTDPSDQQHEIEWTIPLACSIPNDRVNDPNDLALDLGELDVQIKDVRSVEVQGDVLIKGLKMTTPVVQNSDIIETDVKNTYVDVKPIDQVAEKRSLEHVERIESLTESPIKIERSIDQEKAEHWSDWLVGRASTSANDSKYVLKAYIVQDQESLQEFALKIGSNAKKILKQNPQTSEILLPGQLIWM